MIAQNSNYPTSLVFKNVTADSDELDRLKADLKLIKMDQDAPQKLNIFFIN